MDLPASLSDEDMELQKKEWRLVGMYVSHVGDLVIVHAGDNSHRYLRYSLARRLGADTWYYQGYFERSTLKWVNYDKEESCEGYRDHHPRKDG